MAGLTFIPVAVLAVALTIGPAPTPSLAQNTHELVSHVMPLNDRYPVASVSDVFKDNILLTVGYMRGAVADNMSFTWDQVASPFHYAFTLQPGEIFAFHNEVLPQYQGKITKTLDVHFGAQDGFKSDGYLFGDGVCHLASLMNWVAKDAGLKSFAPTNHDFANIPDIPKEYGTAIYADPGNESISAQQNLYITNIKKKPITFVFDYIDNTLTVSVTEEN